MGYSSLCSQNGIFSKGAICDIISMRTQYASPVNSWVWDLLRSILLKKISRNVDSHFATFFYQLASNQYYVVESFYYYFILLSILKFQFVSFCRSFSLSRVPNI